MYETAGHSIRRAGANDLPALRGEGAAFVLRTALLASLTSRQRVFSDRNGARCRGLFGEG